MSVVSIVRAIGLNLAKLGSGLVMDPLESVSLTVQLIGPQT